MEVILLDHIEKVGAKHDVVKVRDGFGRNYLLPQGLALVANKANLARLEGLKKVAGKKEAAVIASFQEIAKQLSGQTLTITVKAGESGRLFGSVTAAHLAQAIQAVGIEVEKRMIEMPDEVKDVGEYKALVKFHPEVIAEVNFLVASENQHDHDEEAD